MRKTFFCVLSILSAVAVTCCSPKTTMLIAPATGMIKPLSDSVMVRIVMPDEAFYAEPDWFVAGAYRREDDSKKTLTSVDEVRADLTHMARLVGARVARINTLTPPDDKHKGYRFQASCYASRAYYGLPTK